MNAKQQVRASKFLSLVLRHKPETVGLTLDPAGWVEVEVLLRALGQHGHALTRDELKDIVRKSDKQRFALSDDERAIRANQGHSLEVELEHPVCPAPELLYHGTAAQWVEAIRGEGLRKMQRHHVHLSAEQVKTLEVGARRGRPVLLTIRAGDMQRAGHVFLRTPNEVWLTDHVPPQFIEFPQEA